MITMHAYMVYAVVSQATRRNENGLRRAQSVLLTSILYVESENNILSGQRLACETRRFRKMTRAYLYKLYGLIRTVFPPNFGEL